MAFAGLNIGIDDADLRRAQQTLQDVGNNISQTLSSSFANNNSRTFAITENGFDVAGSAERFVSGIASGQVIPAILDAGINPIKAGAIAGGIQGALNGGLEGALEGVVGGALNNALANSGIGDALNNAAAQLGVSLPEVPGLPALGGASISGASGGAAASARAGVTRAGTTPASNTRAATTAIFDAADQGVEITIDSFLQSLQGSLSSIAGAGGIKGLLGSLASNLLGSTGLTGALGGLVQGVSEGLSNALGGLTSALGNAATGIMQGLGSAIESIPGVGPALTGMSNAISGFADNLSGAYKNLSPGLQAGVNGAIAAVGANVVNKLDIPGLPRINPTIAGAATAAISFSNNPIAQLNEIATSARKLDRSVFKQTGDTTFANVSSAASRAAKEMQQNVQRDTNGNYQIIKDSDEAAADLQRTGVVNNGEIQPVSNSFFDNLNSIQAQSLKTYENIITSKFSSYGESAATTAITAYREYIEFGKLKTPATRNLLTQVTAQDSNLIKQFADRFLLFYRSDRSRYTMSNL